MSYIFNYPNFSSTDNLILTGGNFLTAGKPSVDYATNYLYLARKNSEYFYAVGIATNTKPVSFNRDFTINFGFKLDNVPLTVNSSNDLILQLTPNTYDFETLNFNSGIAYNTYFYLKFAQNRSVLSPFFNFDELELVSDPPFSDTFEVENANGDILPDGFKQSLNYWVVYEHAKQELRIYYSIGDTIPSTPNHTFSYEFPSGNHYLSIGAVAGENTTGQPGQDISLKYFNMVDTLLDVSPSPETPASSFGSGFLTHEYVYPTGSSNTTASSLGTVNFRQDGAFEIINIKGDMFKDGMTIVGEDSSSVATLDNFDTTTRVEAGLPWDTEFYLVNDAGSVVVEDDFFTGKRSQDYQKNDIIVAINIPVVVPAEDFAIDTANAVVIDGEYVVIPSWFTEGANTSNAALNDYLVVSELE